MDVCNECTDGGQLIICDKCEKCWHRECHPTEITDADMKIDCPWICHLCTTKILKSIKLTKYGHLKGCDSGDPKLPIPECAGITSKGKPCNNDIMDHSCVYYDKKKKKTFAWCHVHRPYQEDHCYDMSQCANYIANKLGFTDYQKFYINQLNIQDKLGIPPEGHLSFRHLNMWYGFHKNIEVIEKLKTEPESKESSEVEIINMSNLKRHRQDDSFDFSLDRVLEKEKKRRHH